MRAIKIVLETPFGWHIRNPATYRVERTYPVIPPTVLFGIVQNLLYTSSHKTKYKDMIALGGFPRSNIGLSLDMERIVKLYTRQHPRTKRYKHVIDRHEVEVAHSDKIDSFLIIENKVIAEKYLELLENKIGDIVLLTTNQFPTIVRDVTLYSVTQINTNTFLFCLEHEGWGLPHILPLSYEFKKRDDYRAQRYYKVLLPFSPILADRNIKKSDIILKSEIKALKINNSNFDMELLKLCKNQWLDKNIEVKIGTI